MTKRKKKHAVPPELIKYYKRRYALFSKFDQGIQLDYQQWFSVTLENVARQISHRILELYPDKHDIVDCFGGAGGNTIQFALNNSYNSVTYVELDEETVDLAINNAAVYGVDSKIDFIHSDFFDYKPPFDDQYIIFMSPPWGGPSYKDAETWDLTTSEPSIIDIIEHARTMSSNICIFLPRNSDVSQIKHLRRKNENLIIDYLYLSGRCQGLCAYFNAQIIK